MNIYDKAHEFANELKNLPEVVEYRKKSQEVNENEDLRKMIEDFRKVQFEAYTEQMQTGKIKDETKIKMQEVANVVMLNPEVSAYIQAEAKFAVIWEDLLKILNEAIGVNVIAPNGN
ncbi:Cell fate regulator YlbF, YheA/YmcA/DUF963 family (controls sporulation, competence, biofilm development) [Clostridium cavendishii DSM 21758]|uniref:Cell fate regulator YlbF, YheA/YmcA/DUF963 family (Controls sporulation, competence, biofilm development) n=1 Tax=Clostridium cavendishii DSM 21758 TaxID=1121302 RepID=A0A1M6KER1_9CLOT|nr:YlbF family regulator [Clostridium cavendishii]SHJ57440.1 Cell fate regulator YlbF, YheA/YmcA/DUF963 family (controls sporulation, competence, biofilm development) [Clostridium cavendishii DSM 21758]